VGGVADIMTALVRFRHGTKPIPLQLLCVTAMEIALNMNCEIIPGCQSECDEAI